MRKMISTYCITFGNVLLPINFESGETENHNYNITYAANYKENYLFQFE